MTRTYSADDRTIEAQPGESFDIEVEGVPTAGYEWSVELDEAGPLRRIPQAPSPPDEAFGGSATERFTFEAKRAGVTTIRLIYGRSWETVPERELLFAVSIERE